MTIDMVQHYTGASARNSSLQITETMALHQTIKSQVEEITKLHQTIQDQISITDKQSKSIRWLSYLVAALTLVQTAATVFQVFPNKPDQRTQTECEKQQITNNNNQPTTGVRNTTHPTNNHEISTANK
jgi:hypothetical protein